MNFEDYLQEHKDFLEETGHLNEKLEWDWKYQANGQKVKHYYSTDPRKKVVEEDGIHREVPYTPKELKNRMEGQRSGKNKRKARQKDITKKRIKALAKRMAKDGYDTSGTGQIVKRREREGRLTKSDLRGLKKQNQETRQNKGKSIIQKVRDMVHKLKNNLK